MHPDEPPPPPAPDTAAEYWTIDDVAAHWGISPGTVRDYWSAGREQLPAPDRMFDRRPTWHPATIMNFQRPGQGNRSDLKNSAPAAAAPPETADPAPPHLADPDADYWTTDDIAAHWGVSKTTVHAYRARGKGELPPQDSTLGRKPLWRPATILNFRRPGRGAGGGRPKKTPTPK
jgi:hypothetical protein